MDFLTGSLCLSIGSAVAWLFALYTPHGEYRLFWNTFFGMAGAFLCALTIARFAPILGVVGLVVAGPVASFVAILAGNAARQSIARMLGLASV